MYLYRLSEAALNNRMEIKPEIPVNFELKNSAVLHMCKNSSLFNQIYRSYIRDRSNLKYQLLHILYFQDYNQCDDFIHNHLPP